MGKYLKLVIFSLLALSFTPTPTPLSHHPASDGPAPSSPNDNGFPPTNDGFALIELFTSEGCSSCPPADDLVASLPKTYPSGVYILSFHVDYWDRMGWKDPFSQAGFTQRQKQYGDVFMLNSIYTPQVVVNGRTEMVGSDKNRLRQAIDDQLAHTTNPPIDATVHATDKTVTIEYTLPNKTRAALQAALIQLQASTAVKKGENAGRQLHHANIVRDLKSSTKNKGSLSLSLPAGLTAADCKVIVFLQDKETLKVEGARLLDIH
ncbi:MAG TPA: DUF1223 domain-containing protein [Puia sp.]|nr:DUF1223 domain-containing protein [Puia sp.]